MRKILNLFSILFLAFIVSCGDNDDKAPDTLELNTNKLTFDEHSGAQYINLTSNAKWTAKVSNSAWLECIPGIGTGNDRIQVKVTDNTTKEARTGSVTFETVGGTIQVVDVIQATAAPYILVQPTSAEALSVGGELEVSVSANDAWTVTIPSEAQSWIAVKSQMETSILFTVRPNDTENDRSANLSFKLNSSATKADFTLSQSKGYTLTSSMNADESLTGKIYSDINSYMKGFGFDYSEHPNCSGGYGGDLGGIHCEVEKDAYFNKYVFRFNIHIDPVIDGDRCSSSTVDRQRNEMKTASNNSTWAKIQGNWDEWQILEWKFKLPKGFQPTSSFCHIHQLKAQDGPNNGSPVITITPRANSNGSNRRMQIIHSVDGASTGKGTVVDNIPLTDFEDEWVQVREEVHYTHNGYYSCKIVRISDGKVLIDYKDENIDMWRSGASYIRSKHGIYRSLAGGNLSKNPVGQSTLLKNESIWLCDFLIYEKNPNPNPGQAHD